MAALREIQKLQKTTHLIMPRTRFSKLVREIIFEDIEVNLNRAWIQRSALDVLQEACEALLVSYFKGINK